MNQSTIKDRWAVAYGTIRKVDARYVRDHSHCVGIEYFRSEEQAIEYKQTQLSNDVSQLEKRLKTAKSALKRFEAKQNISKTI